MSRAVSPHLTYAADRQLATMRLILRSCAYWYAIAIEMLRSVLIIELNVTDPLQFSVTITPNGIKKALCLLKSERNIIMIKTRSKA